MSERASYAPGTPSWVDLGSPNPTAAAEFYRNLFGWTIEADARPEAGGYAMCMLRGRAVAGLGPQMNPDMPPFWSVYVSVKSADETLGLAGSNGGTVVLPAMDVLDVGRMGIFQDPGGSFLSVWEPRAHIGAGLVNEPGAFAWCELATSDVPTVSGFYQQVLGWGLLPEGSSDTSAIYTVDGEVVCGAHHAGPGEFPSWSAWFSVSDCDASAAKVVELGGSVLMPPNDMDFGRGAVVADRDGAAFGIGTMKSSS
jgi:predicted enzyme related to lactoylglutathione lyase